MTKNSFIFQMFWKPVSPDWFGPSFLVNSVALRTNILKCTVHHSAGVMWSQRENISRLITGPVCKIWWHLVEGMQMAGILPVLKLALYFEYCRICGVILTNINTSFSSLPPSGYGKKVWSNTIAVDSYQYLFLNHTWGWYSDKNHLYLNFLQ